MRLVLLLSNDDLYILLLPTLSTFYRYLLGNNFLIRIICLLESVSQVELPSTLFSQIILGLGGAMEVEQKNYL